MSARIDTVKPEFPLVITKKEFNRLCITNKNKLIYVASAVKRDTLINNKLREK